MKTFRHFHDETGQLTNHIDLDAGTKISFRKISHIIYSLKVMMPIKLFGVLLIKHLNYTPVIKTFLKQLSIDLMHFGDLHAIDNTRLYLN